MDDTEAQFQREYEALLAYDEAQARRRVPPPAPRAMIRDLFGADEARASAVG